MTDATEVLHLPTEVEEVLDAARAGDSGRAARTLVKGAGARLKQTLLALTAGTVLADHEAPGEASLQVLRGSVRLTADDVDLPMAEGAYAPIPATRHGVRAIEDAVVLLTVAADG